MDEMLVMALIKSLASRVAKQALKNATVYSFRASIKPSDLNTLTATQNFLKSVEAGWVYNILPNSDEDDPSTYYAIKEVKIVEGSDIPQQLTSTISVQAGANIAWTRDGWDVLSGVIDTSGLVPKQDGYSLMSDEEHTKLANAYVVPEGGIPSTDMTEEVQADLAKAHESASEKKIMTSICPKRETSSQIVTDALGGEVINYKIYGNSVQDGTPTPTNPVAIQTVGDLVVATDPDYEGHEGKYRIPVTVKGKNLFNTVLQTASSDAITITDNHDGSITMAGDSPVSGNWHQQIGTFVGDGSDITLSGLPLRANGGSESNRYALSIRDAQNVASSSDKCSVVSNSGVETKSFKSIAGQTYYVYMFVWHGTNVDGLVVKPQIEKGSVATEYQPYYNQTFNIYTDEPLRKVGDYADYIDFTRKKVVRKIIKLSNSDEGTIRLDDTYSNSWRFGIQLSSNLTLQPNSTKVCSISNKFTALPAQYIMQNGSYAIAYYGENTGFRSVKIRIPFDNNLNVTDLESFRTWWSDNSSNIKVYLSANDTVATEDIDLPDIVFTQSINYISFGSATSPSGSLFEYYQSANDVANNAMIDGMLLGMYPHDSKVLRGHIQSNVMKVEGIEGYPSHIEINSLDLPFVTSIDSSAFYDIRFLSFIKAPRLKTIGSYAFINLELPDDEELYLPELTTVAYDTFRHCKIKNINLPKLQALGFRTFENNTKLVQITLPLATQMLLSGGAFSGCSNLETVILPVMTNIIADTFKDCAKLDTIVLGNSSVVTLANVNAFAGTPFASGGAGGTIYVPSNLVTTYQSASNWSVLYAQGTVTFTAIEGSEFE